MSIVADYPIEGGVRGTDDVEAEGGYLVAETVAKVNASLLCAAPELLTALESLLSGASSYLGEDEQCMKDARAIVAKATGSAS